MAGDTSSLNRLLMQDVTCVFLLRVIENEKPRWPSLLLGEFAELPKRLLASSCPPVRLSVRME